MIRQATLRERLLDRSQWTRVKSGWIQEHGCLTFWLIVKDGEWYWCILEWDKMVAANANRRSRRIAVTEMVTELDAWTTTQNCDTQNDAPRNGSDKGPHPANPHHP